jgi:hypothetical protein
MILASCHVQGAKLQADLGQAETIITQLGFPPREGDDTPYTTRVFARWRLTQAGVEHLERVRDGGNLAVYVTPETVLLNHGESLAGLYPRPEGVHRPNVNPHSPIWHLVAMTAPFGTTMTASSGPTWRHHDGSMWPHFRRHREERARSEAGPNQADIPLARFGVEPSQAVMVGPTQAVVTTSASATGWCARGG